MKSQANCDVHDRPKRPKELAAQGGVRAASHRMP